MDVFLKDFCDLVSQRSLKSSMDVIVDSIVFIYLFIYLFRMLLFFPIVQDIFIHPSPLQVTLTTIDERAVY